MEASPEMEKKLKARALLQRERLKNMRRMKSNHNDKPSSADSDSDDSLMIYHSDSESDESPPVVVSPPKKQKNRRQKQKKVTGEKRSRRQRSSRRKPVQSSDSEIELLNEDTDTDEEQYEEELEFAPKKKKRKLDSDASVLKELGIDTSALMDEDDFIPSSLQNKIKELSRKRTEAESRLKDHRVAEPHESSDSDLELMNGAKHEAVSGEDIDVDSPPPSDDDDDMDDEPEEKKPSGGDGDTEKIKISGPKGSELALQIKSTWPFGKVKKLLEHKFKKTITKFHFDGETIAETQNLMDLRRDLDWEPEFLIDVTWS